MSTTFHEQPDKNAATHHSLTANKLVFLVNDLVAAARQALSQANLTVQPATLWPSDLIHFGWDKPVFRISELMISLPCLVQDGSSDQLTVELLGERNVANRPDRRSLVICVASDAQGEAVSSQVRLELPSAPVYEAHHTAR